MLPAWRVDHHVEVQVVSQDSRSCTRGSPLLGKGETSMTCVGFLLFVVIPIVSLYMVIDRFRESYGDPEEKEK